MSQLTDEEMLRLALTESAKLVPYIISSRKTVKQYLKVSDPVSDFWFGSGDSNDGLEMLGVLVERKR
jgi:nucleolar complex protein 2